MRVEEWRKIPSMGGFEMSDTGRVRDAETKRLYHILFRGAYKENKFYQETFPELSK